MDVHAIKRVLTIHHASRKSFFHKNAETSLTFP